MTTKITPARRATVRDVTMRAIFIANNGGEESNHRSFEASGDTQIARLLEMTDEYVRRVRTGHEHLSPHSIQWLRDKVVKLPGGRKINFQTLGAAYDAELLKQLKAEKKSNPKKKRTKRAAGKKNSKPSGSSRKVPSVKASVRKPKS